MKNLSLFILTSFLAFSLLATDAEARRLGGGKSFGRSAPTFQNSPTQQAQPRQNQAGAPGRTSSGASRWLGPLAGLAAGGLLAALLFGDAFDGFQFFDFLLIIGLVFGALYLFRALRAKTGTVSPMSRQAYAPAGPATTSGSFETPEIGSGPAGSNAVEYRPSWFDEEKFLQGAKTHFIRLLADWDVGNMKDIRDYTTPELFAELTLERQSYQGQEQFTEVVNLEAELLSLVKENDQIVASVRYSGMIQEDKTAEPHAFSEIWHVQRALNDANANWHVAGIEQKNKPA
jgi:predicted lipid-binding transport protein (Tim44 family)